MSNDWSYHKLVKEYGEDIAILLLEFMEGFGEYDPKTSHWEDRRDTPYDEVYEIELPTGQVLFKDPDPIYYTRIDVGVDITLWRKLLKKEPENTSST